MSQELENRNNSLLPLGAIFALIFMCFIGLYISLDSESEVLEDSYDEGPETQVELYNISVNPGDNLTKIFHSIGLGNKEVALFSNLGKKAKPLYDLKPKQTMSISVDKTEQRCVNLSLWLNNEEKLEFAWNEDHYDISRTKQQLATSINYAKIVVKHSLLEDAIKAGVSKNIVYQLTEALGWEIDFIKDLRSGDEFKLLYKQVYVPNKGYVDGDLEEVVFTNRTGEFRADKFQNYAGLSAFYLPDGRRLSRDFLTRPLKYTRVSSPYSLSRKHPLLGISRPHHGVDLAAKYGSPVWATGQGKVVFVGNKSGYGKTIVVQHNYKYKTLYAHLSKYTKGLHKGSKVAQGQIIGYVGMTGITTGPHLHYEFRINNAPVNPMTVKIPRSPSLAKKDVEKFKNTLAKNDEIRAQIQRAREDL
ncbi:MAG: peptidoglycan DD-metalloendopeptidase family protein [Legionellales bacterium]|jgi:murein DD-endopeptidase MepM/ murein hydrolase activator NlpD|nr:peptidoglycan DD-metalloendopeptidase family protein [Legionellales bacterium]